MTQLTILTVRKCPCGDSSCRIYYPSPIGTFYQGSGFTWPEAHAICIALAATYPDSFIYSEQLP